MMHEPGGKCPGGKCPGGTCPGGGGVVLSPFRFISFRNKLKSTYKSTYYLQVYLE